MSYTKMIKSAVEAGNHELVQQLVHAAMDHYTEKIVGIANETKYEDIVFLSAGMKAINAALEQTMGQEGIKLRDSLLAGLQIQTVDLSALREEREAE